ncbi:MAG: hypothetical protein JWO36_5523 [Myxococcales bacterium]|nr:hypothetical protein [Myxococcales bacterium]
MVTSGVSVADSSAGNGGEANAPAGIATISALIVVAAFVASKAARDAILLASFKVTALPLFIGISAVLSFPIILVTGKLMTRHGPGRLIPLLNLGSAALALGEWLALQTSPKPAAVAIFFHLSISGAVLVSGFWSIVNERFDVQTAKRHIGRIGMGATLGGIAGGLIAERTAVYMTPDKILLVLAGMQLVCAVVLLLFRGSPRPEPAISKDNGTWSALRVVTKSPLLRNVAVVVVLGAVAAGVMDYIFKADIVAGSTKEGLLRSLAIFYTVTNVVTAVVQAAIGGAVIARLGVPRSVATLPITVTVFGVIALAIPNAIAMIIARGTETITRNSIYRGGYELMYAPLAEEHKRPTKVVLDVGAERLGDMLGAQLVGAIVFFIVVPRTPLLIAMVVTGVIAVMFALRLPKSYTHALEESLIARAAESPSGESPAIAEGAPAVAPERWTRVGQSHTFGQSGDFPSLSLLRIPAQRAREAGKPQPRQVARLPTAPQSVDSLIRNITTLRSGDLAAVRQLLATPVTIELAPHVLLLVGRDDQAGVALAALGKIARKCTGMLVDALLDPERDITVRRRVPAVLVQGEPTLAAWGLWRGLADASFEVRYRCGVALSRLGATGKLPQITPEEVYELVRRELLVDKQVWQSHRLLDDLVAATELEGKGEEGILHHAGSGLEHVFTMLGLVLPPEPLRIALHAVQTDDPTLRGTALEYLESILPADVRAQLWPLLQGESESKPAAAATPSSPAQPAPETTAQIRVRRTLDELQSALHQQYPSVLEKLRQRRKPG